MSQVKEEVDQEKSVDDAVTDTSIPFSWEYELKRNDWVRYSKEVVDQINKDCGEEKTVVKVEDCDLELHFKDLKQVNQVSGFRKNFRPVLFVDENVIYWEVMRKNRYAVLPLSLQIELEKCLMEEREEVDVKIDEDVWTANVTTLQAANSLGTKMKLRRQESNAKASISNMPTLPAEKTETLTKRSLRSVTFKRETVQVDEEDYTDENMAPPKKKSAPKVIKSTVKSKSKVTSGVVKSTKRTLLIKGRAPVDPECTEKVNTAHVLDEGMTLWDAMLNQTNIANNNNKYYILQLLEDDNAKKYSVWFRWGRVGYSGQNSLNAFGSYLDGAKKCFVKKFMDKTNNEWTERDQFEAYPNKYTLIKMDYSVPQNGAEMGTESGDVVKDEDLVEMMECKLDERVKSFIQLISNRNTMEEAVLELEYDSAKAPLGKLTVGQIEEGYRILGDIEKFVKQNKFDRGFLDLVNEYYTKIPHNFGFRQPPLLKTTELIQKETLLLSLLEEIEIAIKTIGAKRKAGDNRDPIDRYYDSLECDIVAMDETSDEYKCVEHYLLCNHAPTHMYKMNITNIFAVKKHGEDDKFKKELGNRMLLWHGSRLANWYGILSKGLRIAPPDAPSCGYMFGKGIYFADVASKSGNYCYPAAGKPGVLLLADVALGNSKTLLNADYNADKLDKGYHSTFGEGKNYPCKDEYVKIEDEITVPSGKLMKRDQDKQHSLLYNEYIVYNVDQVRMKYIVEVEFDM